MTRYKILKSIIVSLFSDADASLFIILYIKKN